METSISECINTPSQSSHKPSKRPATQRHKKSNGASKPPKRRKRAVERSMYSFDIGDAEDDYNKLSKETKEKVLKLRKIKDPFDSELQQVVDEVFTHIDQQQGGQDVDLAESALLLSGVTHVYSSQVKNVYDQLLAMAERLTGRENPNKKRRKTTEKENDAKEEGQGNASQAEGSTAPVIGDDGKPVIEENTDVDKVPSEAVNLPNAIDGQGETDGATTIPGDAENCTENNKSILEDSGDNATESVSTDDVATQVVNGNDKETLEAEIFNEIVGPCTRRQSERLKTILCIEKEKERDYSLKKKKFDDDPPELISCHEEWTMLQDTLKDIDFDERLPPVLEVQVGRRKKKVTMNNNEPDNDDDGDCEACQNATCESLPKSPEDELTASLRSLMSSSGNGQYETLDHLSDDVQEKFHEIIKDIHKLPFEYGLNHMQDDFFKAYQQKFLQAVTLLSQNSVLVKKCGKSKDIVDDQNASNTELTLSDSQVSVTDKTLSSIEELLNQVRQQATEEYHKGRQSKSDAEVPISQMIFTLKRIICSRYKKWHLEAEHNKEVYKRIKDFENKVKSVLKRESELGLFDVKKYEMEVMDVTIKESHDNECDEIMSPLSPILPEGAESPRSEDVRNWNLACSSRRTSIAESVEGSSNWIRLMDIFSHMKKIDNSETCRHFYAVLALLSHKNLSVNYDTLFSQESAKLITKLMKKYCVDKTNSNKYPVGAKIMTSRCPDFDRDEIFLAPVFNTDTFKQFLEQDGYLSSSGYQSDSQGSNSTNELNYQQPKSIQDAISEFVDDPGEPFSIEDFISKRKRRK